MKLTGYLLSKPAFWKMWKRNSIFHFAKLSGILRGKNWKDLKDWGKFLGHATTNPSCTLRFLALSSIIPKGHGTRAHTQPPSRCFRSCFWQSMAVHTNVHFHSEAVKIEAQPANGGIICGTENKNFVASAATHCYASRRIPQNLVACQK